MTREELARRLDVGLRRLQRWLAGETVMPYGYVAAVGAILDKPVEWFYAIHEDVPA